MDKETLMIISICCAGIAVLSSLAAIYCSIKVIRLNKKK
jgi:hypothetical protein